MFGVNGKQRFKQSVASGSAVTPLQDGWLVVNAGGVVRRLNEDGTVQWARDVSLPSPETP